MDTSEGSVAHRNFTTLAEAAKANRDGLDTLRQRVEVLERLVATQEGTINELRGMVYSMRGTGATS